VTLVGELVLDAHRRLGHDDPRDNPFGFELPQPLRQHPIADVGDGRAQLGKSHPPVQQELDERARPAPADELDRLVKLHAQLGLVARMAHAGYFSANEPLDTSYLL